ncbi:hypothetical protein CLAIMM_02182, partial [Cladophialophora immunda]
LSHDFTCSLTRPSEICSLFQKVLLRTRTVLLSSSNPTIRAGTILRVVARRRGRVKLTFGLDVKAEERSRSNIPTLFDRGRSKAAGVVEEAKFRPARTTAKRAATSIFNGSHRTDHAHGILQSGEKRLPETERW